LPTVLALRIAVTSPDTRTLKSVAKRRSGSLSLPIRFFAVSRSQTSRSLENESNITVLQPLVRTWTPVVADASPESSHNKS